MTQATIDDLDVHYHVQGDGPVLLFLHGLGSSGQDWSPQVDAFQDHYQCITYDIRGHGRSGKPPGPYSMAQFAGDATGLPDHLPRFIEKQRAIFTLMRVGHEMRNIIQNQMSPGILPPRIADGIIDE